MTPIRQYSTAISIAFAFNGALFGAWAARIPFFKDALALSEQDLSIVLFVLAFGAVVSFPLAGRLSDRMGAHLLTKVAFLLYPVPFIALGFSESVVFLSCCLFLFGFLHGGLDVAMNSWASDAEEKAGKKLMPFFHAMFSLGAGIGAGIGAIVISLEISPAVHFIAFSMAFLFLFQYVNIEFGRTHGVSIPIPQGHGTTPVVTLLIMGGIALSCAIGEGAMADWSAVFMYQEINVSLMDAAWAYTVFSVFMVISRFAGHVVTQVLGVVLVVRVCAVLSFVGAFILFLASGQLAALTGFALLGMGYSIVIPLVFSAAASVNKARAGRSIAFVATFCYGGMLLGPVIIGLIAHATSLRNAFILLVALPVFTLCFAHVLRKEADVSTMTARENTT